MTGVRGAGLLLGVTLAAPVSGALQTALLEAGFLTNAVRPDVLRLAPPLIISAEQIEALLAALPAALDTAAEPGEPHEPATTRSTGTTLSTGEERA